MKPSRTFPLGALALSLMSVACGSSSALPAVADAAPAPAAQASAASSDFQGSTCSSITDGISVCATTTECPGVVINPAKFSQCGYLIHGDAIDPECLCYGSLCPMGAPTSCADMTTLLASGVTLSIVCEQEALGHCRNLGGAGTPSACQICKNNCNGVPSCEHNCGC